MHTDKHGFSVVGSPGGARFLRTCCLFMDWVRGL